MNRQLKFKVWNKKFNKYVYSITIGNIEANINSGLHGVTLHEGTTDISEIAAEDCVTLQYTGLKDKNGKEIYEGDILSFRKKTLQVKYGNAWNGEDDYIGFFTQELRHNLSNFGSCRSNKFTQGEVIGNIFETPELLKSVV